ncbi:hypothetical protein AMECASPLE_037066 [Ameca splendens]|uniref:Uncharacterized protein n=1 Tax=Ameca splendens TaxID=208324 RepID=A0ABV1AFQ9_9TELE
MRSFRCKKLLFVLHKSLRHSGFFLQTPSVSSGIGFATQVVIAYAAVSYIVIQAWAFFYLFSSFSAELPWASCRNSWNTGRCSKKRTKLNKNILLMSISIIVLIIPQPGPEHI